MPGSDPERCQRVGVRAYPTWIINGERLEGVLDLAHLAQASRFGVAGR